MELPYINAFTTTLFELLKDYLNIKSKKDVIEIKKFITPIKGVAVLVGISGDRVGKCVLDFNVDTGHSILAKLNDEEKSQIYRESGERFAREQEEAPCRNVLLEVFKERQVQDAKWGGRNHDDTHRCANPGQRRITTQVFGLEAFIG